MDWIIVGGMKNRGFLSWTKKNLQTLFIIQQLSLWKQKSFLECSSLFLLCSKPLSVTPEDVQQIAVGAPGPSQRRRQCCRVSRANMTKLLWPCTKSLMKSLSPSFSLFLFCLFTAMLQHSHSSIIVIRLHMIAWVDDVKGKGRKNSHYFFNLPNSQK